MTKRRIGLLTAGIFMVAALGAPTSALATTGRPWSARGVAATTHASAALSAADSPTTSAMVDECNNMMQRDPTMSAMMAGASGDMMGGGMTGSGMMGRQAMVADR